MDKVTNYRRILRRLVTEYAQYRPSHGEIEPIGVCDSKSDNYLLIHAGWDNNRRIHVTVFHLRLHNGKILIEEDGLEHGIAQDLLDAAVPPRDIVYALEKKEVTAAIKAS